MKYSVRKFTALLLALVMVLSIAPLDAVASVFSAYEANIVVDTSESVQISEAIVTSKVTSKDGFSAEVSSIDDILPADGWVGFSEAKKQEEEPKKQEEKKPAEKPSPAPEPPADDAPSPQFKYDPKTGQLSLFSDDDM